MGGGHAWSKGPHDELSQLHRQRLSRQRCAHHLHPDRDLSDCVCVIVYVNRARYGCAVRSAHRYTPVRMCHVYRVRLLGGVVLVLQMVCTY